MRADFMQNFPTEKNVPTVYDYPIGSPQGKKDVHNPVGIDSLERFGKIG